jgi:hypothetical protein
LLCVGAANVAGVHAEEAGYEGEREEDDGDNGKSIDGLVLPVFGRCNSLGVLEYWS